MIFQSFQPRPSGALVVYPEMHLPCACPTNDACKTEHSGPALNLLLWFKPSLTSPVHSQGKAAILKYKGVKYLDRTQRNQHRMSWNWTVEHTV